MQPGQETTWVWAKGFVNGVREDLGASEKKDLASHFKGLYQHCGCGRMLIHQNSSGRRVDLGMIGKGGAREM